MGIWHWLFAMRTVNQLSDKNHRTETIDVAEINTPSYYADFTRVAPMAEEVVIYFGTLTRVAESDEYQAKVSQHLVMSKYTAKRLHTALCHAVENAEAQRGIVDTGAKSPQEHVDIIASATKLYPTYVNFVRVAVMPEETVLDFGLNRNDLGADQAVTISDSVVMNHHSLKRLMKQLGLFIKQIESRSGEIETDVRRRLSQKGTSE